MSQITCTITVAGELDPRLDKAIDGLDLSTAEGNSQLSGQLADRAQLQGVLRHLFDLGLEVVAFTSTTARGSM